MPWDFWSLQIGGSELKRRDEVMKTYLLGGLDEARRSRLEERLLSDRELLEELLISEDELVDEYIAGKLSDVEKSQFESHFLITPERQWKFGFGHAFNKYLELNDFQPAVRERSTKTAGFFSGSFAFWPLRHTVTAAFVLVVVTVLSFAAYWVGVRRSAVGSGSSYVVSLVPGATRSVGSGFQRLKLPNGVTSVELRLAVADVSYKSYVAQLISGTGKSTEIRNLHPLEQKEGKWIVTTIPKDLLVADDYQVKLTGISASGEEKLIDTYSFGIVEP